MDYQKHYDRLIDRARDRVLTGYSERHHIVPKCIGGTEAKANLVHLTAEGHFVAHQLLVKLHPDNGKLLWALSAMTNATKRHWGRSNKRYGWMRRRFAEMIGETHRGRTISPETRAKMSAAKIGKPRGPFSDEHKARLSAASKGREKSDAHRTALSEAKTGKKYGPRSAERIERQRNGILQAMATQDQSYRQSPEYRAARSEGAKRQWRNRRAEP